MVDVMVWMVIGMVGGVLATIAVYRVVWCAPAQWAGAVVFVTVCGLVGGWLTTVGGGNGVGWAGALVAAFCGAVLVLCIQRGRAGRHRLARFRPGCLEVKER